MMQYYVYFLTNWNNRVLYVGVTNNLERRLYKHKHELMDGFTKRYHVHKLVYFKPLLTFAPRSREKNKLKGGREHKRIN